MILTIIIAMIIIMIIMIMMILIMIIREFRGNGPHAAIYFD